MIVYVVSDWSIRFHQSMILVASASGIYLIIQVADRGVSDLLKHPQNHKWTWIYSGSFNQIESADAQESKNGKSDPAKLLGNDRQLVDWVTEQTNFQNIVTRTILPSPSRVKHVSCFSNVTHHPNVLDFFIQHTLLDRAEARIVIIFSLWTAGIWSLIWSLRWEFLQTF